MKAGRYLAGHRAGSGGARPMPVQELVRHPELLDEGISANRLEEAEQLKTSLRRSEMRAFIAALALPADWFDGLYPADKGDVKTPFGELLRGIAAAGREIRRAPEEARPGAGGSRRRPATEAAGDT